MCLLLVATCLLSCSPHEEALRIGTSSDYAPFSLDGAGFDVDVAELLSAELGMPIEWRRFRWPELARDVRENRFDVAMSGVTWRPERAVLGRMSLAVASGGPCVLGDPEPRRLAVNRGGVLERWARRRFPEAEIYAVADNLSLPARLESRSVDAIVTDSFELAHFRRPGFAERCEPPHDRKVYWIAPAAAATLGPAIDRFLREREPELEQLRTRHFGTASERAESDHLIDLMARRLALMPAVAAWKRRNDRPISDPAREELVLARVAEQVAAVGLEPAAALRLFELQIELARAVQARAPEVEPLDLPRELRPTLLQLGLRIVNALARAAPIDPIALDASRLAPLVPLLEANEIAQLRAAILAVRKRDSVSPAAQRRP